VSDHSSEQSVSDPQHQVETIVESARTPWRRTAEQSSSVASFWVSTFPFFESTLFVAPPFVDRSACGAGEETTGTFVASSVTLFDADGGVVNEFTVEVEPGRVGIVELDQFLGGCKLESGLRHAQMRVVSPPGTRQLCRLHGRAGAQIVEESSRLTRQRSVFFPVRLAPQLEHVVCFINLGGEPAVAKCRLLVGNRTPEVFVEVPANGARLLSLTTEFGDFGAGGGGDGAQAYVRLSTKGDAVLGAQVLQRVVARDERVDNDAYTLVS
jgi:hypothetical protein